MALDADFQSLIQRVCSGDLAATEEVMRGYELAVRVAVRTRLLDPKLRQQLDPIDVWQSVLASFFLRATSGQYWLNELAQLVALLAMMVQNKLAMRARHAYRDCRYIRRSRPLADDLSAPDSMSPEPAGQVADRDLFEHAVTLMDPEVKEIAALRIDGYDWPEVASRLGVTPVSCRKQFKWAMNKIARELGVDRVARSKRYPITSDPHPQLPALHSATEPFATEPFTMAMHRLRGQPRHQWLALARQDQCERWRKGEPIPAEAYFAELADLKGDLEESLILVCGEVNLREELGEVPNAAEFRKRFPEWSDNLAIHSR